MAAPQQQLWRPIPYSHNDLVAAEQGVERLVKQPREPEVPNLDVAGRGHHDVGGLEVAVQHPVGVQILTPIEQLEHDALDGAGRDAMARLLRVVVDDLQQVVLGVFEHHEDALVLENDLNQADHIVVLELRAECHFSDGGLRNARVLYLLALLVGLELLNGEVARLALPAMGLVHATVGSAANKPNDAVLFHHLDLGLVGHLATPVTRI